MKDTIKFTRKNKDTRIFRFVSVDEIKAIIEVTLIDSDTGKAYRKREEVLSRLDAHSIGKHFQGLTKGQVTKLASMVRELVPASLKYTYQTY